MGAFVQFVLHRLHVGHDGMVHVLGGPVRFGIAGVALVLVCIIVFKMRFQHYSSEVRVYIVFKIFVVIFPRIGDEVHVFIEKSECVFIKSFFLSNLLLGFRDLCWFLISQLYFEGF